MNGLGIKWQDMMGYGLLIPVLTGCHGWLRVNLQRVSGNKHLITLMRSIRTGLTQGSRHFSRLCCQMPSLFCWIPVAHKLNIPTRNPELQSLLPIVHSFIRHWDLCRPKHGQEGVFHHITYTSPFLSNTYKGSEQVHTSRRRLERTGLFLMADDSLSSSTVVCVP